MCIRDRFFLFSITSPPIALVNCDKKSARSPRLKRTGEGGNTGADVSSPSLTGDWMAKIRSRMSSGSEKKFLLTLLLFLPFADWCSASKTSDFEPDALVTPAFYGFGLKAAWFSTILLNFDFNEVRFLVKCCSFVKISSMLTGAFPTIVNGASALRRALGVPLPG